MSVIPIKYSWTNKKKKKRKMNWTSEQLEEKSKFDIEILSYCIKFTNSQMTMGCINDILVHNLNAQHKI